MGMFSKTKKVSLLTRGQKAVLKKSSGILGEQLGQGVDAYGGTVTPSATALQNQVFQQSGGAMLGAANQANPAITDMLAGNNAQGFNAADYAQQSILNPATLALRDEQERLEAMYGGSWGQTGGFQDVMQKSTARFGVGIGEQMAEFARNQRDVANQQRQFGVQGSLDQSQNLADTYQNLLNFGGEQRAIEGQQKGETYNKWLSEQAYNNPWLALMNPVLNTRGFALGQKQGWLSKVKEVADTGKSFAGL